MKIEKRGQDSYRVRKMYKGRTYTITFEHKPTQKEAMLAMADELQKVQKRHESRTFHAAAGEYIESKRNVLSPTTIRGYNSTLKTLSEHFLNKNIYDITALDIQAEINRLAKEHSPKTVRNYHGLISAVMGTFCPSLKICTTLPQKVKKEPYIPSDEDVKRILECAMDTEYEIPLILACYGLRRSEICALTTDDLDGDIIKINKAKVLDEDTNWIEKTTKTTSSTREIVIPMEIADKIREKGYIYKGHPNSITLYLGKTESRLGIPHFPLHKLRHYFASKMSALHVPEADIMKMGGWETDHVMKSVYRHSMIDKEEQAKRDAAEKLRNVLFT
ncbi:MAG: tyrosine-type recombinase/integrase [Butyrivibrio sp.]|nr:tyrosine-type recombinase/integrase [Acetatifactor muris]MCM1561217.1 tyrosine-type recombinase/integrase [Butyrivibrio sp.]